MERRYHARRALGLPHVLGLLACAIGVAGFTGQVRAVDTANVTIRGTINAGTCDIAAGDVNKNVTLPTVQVGDLPSSGAYGFEPFTLTVSNCDAGLASAVFTFTGTQDATDPLRFKNADDGMTGGATGVAVELESDDGVNIGANGTNNSRAMAITNSQAVLNLKAGYWRLPGAALKAGSVTATATVNMSYN